MAKINWNFQWFSWYFEASFWHRFLSVKEREKRDKSFCCSAEKSVITWQRISIVHFSNFDKSVSLKTYNMHSFKLYSTQVICHIHSVLKWKKRSRRKFDGNFGGKIQIDRRISFTPCIDVFDEKIVVQQCSFSMFEMENYLLKKNLVLCTKCPKPFLLQLSLFQ